MLCSYKNKILSLFLVLISLFFVIYQKSITHYYWQGRTSPVEPDDSYIYIAQIEKFSLVGLNAPSSIPSLRHNSLVNGKENFYPAWEIFWGSIKNLFKISSEDTFKLSFVLGHSFLLLSLLFLFFSLYQSSLLAVAISIFTIGFYHGGGWYHGFFWVVPSFYMICLFFLKLAVIFNKSPYLAKSFTRTTFLFLLGLLSLFTHPLGLISVLLCLGISGILALLKRKKKELINPLILIICVFAALGLRLLLLETYKTQTLPWIKDVLALFENIRMPASFNRRDGWDAFSKWYITDLFRFYLYIPLILSMFYIIKNREHNWIALIIGTILTFSGLFIVQNAYFYRFLIFLWPLTFIIFGYGIYHTFQMSIKETAKFKKITFLVLSLVSLACVVNYGEARRKSFKKHVPKKLSLENFDRKIPLKLNNCKDCLIFEDNPKIARNFFFSNGLHDQPIHRINRIKRIDKEVLKQTRHFYLLCIEINQDCDHLAGNFHRRLDSTKIQTIQDSFYVSPFVKVYQYTNLTTPTP